MRERRAHTRLPTIFVEQMLVALRDDVNCECNTNNRTKRTTKKKGQTFDSSAHGEG